MAKIHIMEKTARIPANKRLYFAAPVDFSNIENNPYAQKMLLKLKGKSKIEIRQIVHENMLAMAKEGIKRDTRKLALAGRLKKAGPGYLNTRKKIEHFWKEVAKYAGRQAIGWMEKTQ